MTFQFLCRRRLQQQSQVLLCRKGKSLWTLMTNTNLIIVRLMLNKEKRKSQIAPNKHLIEETDEILICITCHLKTHYIT